jgi:hypothetical protein
MKKWVVPILSVLLVIGLVYLSGPFNVFKINASRGDRGEDVRTNLTQAAEREKEEGDSQGVQLLKRIQGQLDEWLKSINDRIDSEDVSRLEVRFLEILRNILEWLKEKVDKQIESSKGKGLKEKGPFKET